MCRTRWTLKPQTPSPEPYNLHLLTTLDPHPKPIKIKNRHQTPKKIKSKSPNLKQGLGVWGLGFRALGFRALGFRALGFRALGFRGLGLWGLGV